MSRWLESAVWVSTGKPGPMINGVLVENEPVPGDVESPVDVRVLTSDERYKFKAVLNAFPGIRTYTLDDWFAFDEGHVPYYRLSNGLIHRTTAQGADAVAKSLKRAKALVLAIMGEGRECDVVDVSSDTEGGEIGVGEEAAFTSTAKGDTRISIRREFLTEASDVSILNVVLHEIAHYLTIIYAGAMYEDNGGHGPIWINTCLALGCNGRVSNEVVNNRNLSNEFVRRAAGIKVQCVATDTDEPCCVVLYPSNLVHDGFVKFDRNGVFGRNRCIVHSQPLKLMVLAGERMDDVVRRTNARIDEARKSQKHKPR